MSLLFGIIAFAGLTITSTTELMNALRRVETNVCFDITAQVTTILPGYKSIPVFDREGHAILALQRDISDIRPGDTVHATGRIGRRKYTYATAECSSLDVLSHGPAPDPEPVLLQDLNSGRHDAGCVRVSSTVTDVFRDERNPLWIFLVLSSNDDHAYAAFMVSSDDGFDYKSWVGCRIRITGLVHPDEGGARHHVGRTLIAAGPGSVEILSRPSWWTPSKIGLVFASLVAALIAALVWGCSLRVIAERRSRELLREKIARVSAELRIAERTRLATDLHDSVSQNLTSVSLQINTALRLADVDPARMRTQLERASMSIRVCREELRNCLWDLRSQALDAPGLNEAIRLTLLPLLGNVRMNVRFNVPRHKLRDNTVHTVLQIVRELVSNAIRHGHARNIRIAGSIEDKRLMFSVRDDGCGFDPDNVPGSIDGHFGLQGIRERLQKHHGTMKISSSDATGTKTTITLS